MPAAHSSDWSVSSERVRFRRQRMRCPLSALLVIAILTGSLLVSADGVRADDKTRQIVNGVLQLLIESQRPRNDRGRLVPPPPRPNQEVLAVRNVLSDYRDEAARLSQLAQQEVARSPGLRALIGDVLTQQASAESVVQRAQYMSHPAQVADSVAQLDGGWRVLSWRLKQIRDISRECRAVVERLDQISGRLCELYQIQPQIDRRALQRQADSLTFYLRSLVDDLEIEMRRSPRRQEFILAASSAQQSARVFAEYVARQAPFEQLITSYQEFVAHWGPLARRVCSIDSRFIERNVLSIQEVDQAIHELLWLPRGIDRQLLAQLTNGILSEVDRIYVAVNLNVLIQLPNADNVPAAASEFYGVCQHFADCVRRDESEDDLVDAYGYLPGAWIAFSQLFRNLDHPPIHQSLSEIEQRLVALREPLRIPGGFDRHSLRDRTARLEHLSEHLAEDFNGWLRGRQKFDQDLRALVELSQQLQSDTRVFHVAILQNAPDETLRQLATAVTVKWEALHTRIEECEAGDRDHIQEIQAQISRELIGIQAMFL
jgi:hypothetical protein